MSSRTYGATRNCAGCKFWSEMLARAIGGGPVEAMCLAPKGPHSSAYTTSRVTCSAWENGEAGAVDDPAAEADDEDEIDERFEADFAKVFGS